MRIHRVIDVWCIYCRCPFTLYEYEGLEGGLYTSHWCDEAAAAELRTVQG